MTAPHGTLTIADRSLLAAARLWGSPVEPRFWESFRPGWRDTLLVGWEPTRRLSSEEARDRLRREHDAETRPDLVRVHPSWWIRALKDETPAVRRAVAANVPPAIRGPLLAGLGLRPEDLESDRTPSAEALRHALALWTERLVGDVAERDDDPAVIIALTRLDLRDVARLVRRLGLVKWALAGQDPPSLRARDRERLAQIRSGLGEPNPKLERLAGHDVSRRGPAVRHEMGRLGLITVARLLAVAEPYRVRWALQHLPYPVAKFTRGLMSPKPGHDSSLAPLENDVLGAAWDRLRAEGRIRGGYRSGT